MTIGGVITRRGHVVSRAIVSFCIALFVLVGVASNAAASPWSRMKSPWDASWPINDICAFGSTSLAAAGDEGHIGITRDGGRSWKIIVPSGLEGAAFTAIAVDASGKGVVVSGGLLLFTEDAGSSWRRPTYAGPAPGVALADVAIRGAQAIAVGDDGVIVTSDDSGATWRRLASPTEQPLTCVAIAGDGTAVAGSAAGEILVENTGVWSLVGTATSPITAVAAGPDPVWGDGRPDLFAATGTDILGSDDSLTFGSLPGLPVLSTQAWPALAWAGLPQRSLLIAGGANAGFFQPLDHSWTSGPTGLAGAVVATAPGGQSVGYLLAPDGLVRTLSAGREAATLEPTQTRMTVGGTTTLKATVNVAAPGTVYLQQRIPGRAWKTVKTLAWTTGDWGRGLSSTYKPSFTTEYRLRFKYGAAVSDLSTAKVVVAPRILTTRAKYRLRVGDVYRFSGKVTPALPGARIVLYTDRGGSWRPVSQQGSLSLRGGRTWTSRQFGTPAAETYHLRAHLPATRVYGEAWSRVVTVTIR